MAAVLGVSAYYHDAAAALVVDGTLVAAIQEERLSGTKHDPNLPIRAMAKCLELGGVDRRDLARVVFYENPYRKLERVLVSTLRGFPRTWGQFPKVLAAQLGGKLWVLDRIAEALDIERRRVRFVEHHQAHAASAFFASPFQEAAVLTVDGVGEEVTTAIYHGQGERLDHVEDIGFPHSLGLFYAGLTAYLGFRVNRDEYKVMGLAAYGQPRFADTFDELLKVQPDGGFEVALEAFDGFRSATRGFGPGLERRLGPSRQPRRPWNLEGDEDRRYADVAASLQRRVEEAMVALARRAKRKTGANMLCLAGGVALNSVANARIAEEAGFERVFVQPAAGDAGGALGAAYLGSIEEGDPRPPPMTNAFLGDVVDVERLTQTAKALGLQTTRVQDPAAEVARAIAEDKVVALAQGRFEWGPRALGGRSILASPRTRETRDRINARIKRREMFRPLAPAVLTDHFGEYFVGAPDDMTPFMTTVRAVQDVCIPSLGAVTHQDGTARVQSVAEESNPWFAQVLRAVHHQTGLPSVLNTSLNGPDMPIASDHAGVLDALLSYPLDRLYVEDVVVEKPQ